MSRLWIFAERDLRRMAADRRALVVNLALPLVLTSVMGLSFGGGIFGMVAGVVLAVVATGVAGFVFTWLRKRSGSLIAPIALHWSLNGVGALAAALVWHLST